MFRMQKILSTGKQQPARSPFVFCCESLYGGLMGKVI
jgi:hypothetical protein